MGRVNFGLDLDVGLLSRVPKDRWPTADATSPTWTTHGVSLVQGGLSDGSNRARCFQVRAGAFGTSPWSVNWYQSSVASRLNLRTPGAHQFNPPGKQIVLVKNLGNSENSKLL